jgi:hypothetical protein
MSSNPLRNRGQSNRSRGHFRARGGHSTTIQANTAHSTSLFSTASTPLPSGATTPAEPLQQTKTRFVDVPGLDANLTKALPFEYCTEVS